MISDEKIAAGLKSIVPMEVLKISALLLKHGHRSWIVGGSVRDVLAALQAGRRPTVVGDWDLATSAPPKAVTKIFRRVIPTGIDHGTVTVVLSKQHFELTTLRGERGHSDGRRPDEVYFVDDLREDLARRDFTVNAMAFNVEDSTFHDPFHGREDLAGGLLRAVGDPTRRFLEDGLRVLRCARFTSTLQIRIEEKTRAAIRPSLESFSKVAQERVRDEWFKALSSKEPGHFLATIREEGLLDITVPGLWLKTGLVSFEEALRRVDAAPPEPLFRLALFLFLALPLQESHHEGVLPTARALAQSVGKGLKLSRIETGRLMLLCSRGSLPQSFIKTPRSKEARLWLTRVGRDDAEELLHFQEFTLKAPGDSLMPAHKLLRNELASGCALSLKELALTGGDLLREGIVPKGPALGQILAGLLSAVLEDPAQNVRDTLLLLAEELYRETQ